MSVQAIQNKANSTSATANLFTAKASNGQGAGGNEERVKAQIWANVMVPITFVDPETKEVVEDSFSLPVNLALDTMNEVDVPTKAPKTQAAALYAQRQAAKNALLHAMLAAAATIEPGEAVMLKDIEELTLAEGATIKGSDVQIQLQRVAEDDPEAAVADANNMFLSGIKVG